MNTTEPFLFNAKEAYIAITCVRNYIDSLQELRYKIVSEGDKYHKLFCNRMIRAYDLIWALEGRKVLSRRDLRKVLMCVKEYPLYPKDSLIFELRQVCNLADRLEDKLGLDRL